MPYSSLSTANAKRAIYNRPYISKEYIVFSSGTYMLRQRNQQTQSVVGAIINRPPVPVHISIILGNIRMI